MKTTSPFFFFSLDARKEAVVYKAEKIEPVFSCIFLVGGGGGPYMILIMMGIFCFWDPMVGPVVYGKKKDEEKKKGL